MVLYYNNFITIYNDIIKFYKFYVHNRMANAIPRSYFIPAMERYCTISNSRTRLNLSIFNGVVEMETSGERNMEKHIFSFFLFFFSRERRTIDAYTFLAAHADPLGNAIKVTHIIYYRRKINNITSNNA